MVEVSLRARVRSQSKAYSKSSLWLVSLCFVLSGATGLIYEVLWARTLGLVFGATTFAISAVLAAFMGGLALGSALAGRLAERIRRPLRAYGLVEIGVAVYALMVPLLFRLVDYLYAFIWEQTHPGFYTFNLWRFALSCLVLLVPTTLMGATLPVLSAAILRSPDFKPTAVTRLYTCNLAGAIFGTIVAGFFLLPALGIRLTIFTAAAINLTIGVGAILIDRKDWQRVAERVANESVEEVGDRVEGIAATAEPVDEGSGKFWLLCAAVSGFVTISTQVAWTRVLTMVIGSSTYAFSIVVALFLLGLAIGAYIVAKRRITTKLRHSIMTIELATAAALFLSIWITNATPGLLIELGLRLEVNSWLGLLSLQILVAALLILVPAILMGMVMPLVLVWASKHGAATVRLVGRSYAVNTLGAIAGAFSTGFILIPKVSTRFTILFAAAVCILLAGLAYRPSVESAGLGLRRTLAAGLTVALILLLTAAPKMRLADLSIGAYDSLVRVLAKSRGSLSDDSGAPSGPDIHELLWYKEGPTATVSVREDWGVRSMAINGRTNASDRDDMPTQVMLGVLPLLVAPHTENGLVVGYGSGVSVGSMLQSWIRALECVELEPAAIDAGNLFNHVNNQPLNDPRLRVIVDDARTYLRVNPTLYDAIVSEPSHPWVPGVANLFTREFFELGHSRLKADGVFVQWLQIYQLSTENLRSVLATFRSVFPHVMIFHVQGAAKGKDLILVGSRQSLTLNHADERMRDGRVARELARINIFSAEDLAAWFVCNETQLDPAIQGAVINTDDNMRVENRAPREAFMPSTQANAEWVESLTNK
ncbi:MAG: fused MFS/spermidine synthase [Acidobacteriota bacterium]|nr:fused MFS/spermidine synthase [Acidobacteriota bacterium]